jgi:RNA polymerase sigma-70 factor (ECF subfamily)
MFVMTRPPPVSAPSRSEGAVRPQDCLAQADLAPLLAAVAGEDRTALARLYDATHRWVFALALRLVGDRHLAEEVTLDVYLQAWRRAGSYDAGRGKAASWLFAIARSRALDALRSRRARLRHEAELPEDLRLAPEDADPHLARQTFDRHEGVRAAIATLPEEQRRAIELAYFPGLSHSQIAARLGLPLGTVKTRVRLAMLKLRERLAYLEQSA